MAGLINKAAERPRLRRAADADRDPADIDGPPLRLDQQQHPARTSADNSDINSASENDSDDAGDAAASSVSSAGTAVEAGESKPPPAARVKTGRSGGSASRSTEGRGREKKKPRRVGRPRGPERVPFSTRILVDLDRAMDAAVETSGLSPQPIIEEALREWFVARGYLDGSDPVRTAEGQVRTDR